MESILHGVQFTDSDMSDHGLNIDLNPTLSLVCPFDQLFFLDRPFDPQIVRAFKTNFFEPNISGAATWSLATNIIF